ncbi:MAG: ROK family protein [Hamadaea sp.]|uniref:ROK family transcriptional regulator n=1 Tax=Hamadaea sp. TaxID=2024425 RepID=UPI0017C3437C|nr:ROK family transcriptional regulator [Hamadaea sp.]NUR72107.1 ROK family protein [Hamadaea sp.]NUT22946.1 ROK family protein [Hamadaea sp.]
MTLPAHLGSTARRVATVLRSRGPRTRAELIGLTGLSRPTVSAALADLTNAGLLTEEAAQTGPAGGRPATVFRLARGAGLAVGVDIGRRHVRVAVADLGHRVLVDYPAVLDLDADDYPESALDAAARQVDAALDAIGADRSEVVGVGLGIPAPLTRTGRIGSPALLPAWADLLPEDELAGRLHLPVRVDNDANLGALGEYVWGAGQQSADLVYVKVATGIGAGIVLDGRLYRGFAGTAGELGHITLDARGPVCRCGNRGCVELSAGGRALLRHARATHPQLESLVDLVDLATLGDPGCRRLLADAGRQLGFALGGLLNLINPERIVLGGELGAATELLLDPLRGGLADTAMAAAASAVEVVPTQLGAQASALGGVALALGVDRSTFT